MRNASRTNLLTEPVFSVSADERLPLPGVLAAMAQGRVSGFPALRPHQGPAWHAFLVQLGALALWTGRQARVPEETATWTELLRALTPEHPDDAPWVLAVEDLGKPAFMQPPAPGNLAWHPVPTPDALDVLITNRNHDVKQTVLRDCDVEDWLFALVSLQTSVGYGGKQNYGIARMNGGSSSRPTVGLAPGKGTDCRVDPSAWWIHDVGRLLLKRRSGGGGDNAVGRPGAPALLWCLDWPEGQRLDLSQLDPWFIEVSRRVRLVQAAAGLAGVRATSSSPRTAADGYHGNLGDPWAPVHRSDAKALTLGEGDFSFRKLHDLMFGGEWHLPALATIGPQEKAGDRLLVSQALSRGNYKTAGFKSRVVPIPASAARMLRSDSTAELSSSQIGEVRLFEEALRTALTPSAGRGDGNAGHRVSRSAAIRARTGFAERVDALFFPYLWARVEARGTGNPEALDDAGRAFRRALMQAAEAELEAALPQVACNGIMRPGTEARAREGFRRRAMRIDPQMRPRAERGVVPSGLEPAVETALMGAALLLQNLAAPLLIQLRRMDADAGAPAFSRLAGRYPDVIGARRREWISLVRILALLTSDKSPARRRPLHEPGRRLGLALCQGAAPARIRPDRWPVLGEQRLAHLLAARGTRRRVLLERAVRAIAQQRGWDNKLNLCDIASVLLDLDAKRTERELAEAYYRALDDREAWTV